MSSLGFKQKKQHDSSEQPMSHDPTAAHSHNLASDESANQSGDSMAKFRMFFRFGTIDNSLLMLSLLAGFSLDSLIERRIGVKGFGPVVGGLSL